MTFFSTKTIALILGCILFIPSAFCEKAVDLDLIRLKSGSILEGSIIESNDTQIKIETMGGIFAIPASMAKVVSSSKPGESELLLGTQLLKQKKIERAKHFLREAQKVSTWRKAAEVALQEVKKLEEEERQKERAAEQDYIENVIRRRGLDAGIEELERRHQSQDSYWGSYRGKLHLLMAKDRLNHLDIPSAERHLVLADQYGVNVDEWQAVRQELLDAKKRSVLFGNRKYANIPKPKPKIVEYSSFLDRVEQAKRKGMKTPPIEWLKHVDYHARENDLDPLLVWAMIDTESSWRPRVISSKGAQGLMQLMPGTAAELNVKDSFNPEENIKGGTKYMRFLLQMFNDTDTALAAYNVGPGTIERSNGIPPAGKRYINKVRKRLATLQTHFGS